MKIVLDKGAYMPTKAHKDDAGFDLRTPVKVLVPARGSATIDTGVHIQLPKKTTGFLKSKSGLNVKYGITSEGVIDVGYTGSIRAKLYNHSDEDYMFLEGDKITQLVILPIKAPKRLKLVEKLKERDRGNNGFGSSGR
jgi:dUTP pyrophosphatase